MRSIWCNINGLILLLQTAVIVYICNLNQLSRINVMVAKRSNFKHPPQKLHKHTAFINTSTTLYSCAPVILWFRCTLDFLNICSLKQNIILLSIKMKIYLENRPLLMDENRYVILFNFESRTKIYEISPLI